ncbi:MAG: hypothetical protein GX815_00910 [Clostridiales bacterium]|nr:hypothetical protein [Clostridiales bacterium]
MRRFIRGFNITILLVVMLFSSVAYASDNKIETFGDIGIFGNYAPTSYWNLGDSDYSFSGTFREYTNTNYYFRPSFSGHLYLSIDGEVASGSTSTLFYSIYERDLYDGVWKEVSNDSLGRSSSWDKIYRISKLNTSFDYYFKFHKPNDGERIKISGKVYRI